MSGRPDEALTNEAAAALMPRLEAYVRRRVRGAAEVDDVVQQALLRCLASPPPAGVSTERWAISIARNLTIDLARRRGRRRSSGDVADVAAPAPTEASDVADKVAACAACLPADARRLLERVALDGERPADLARSAGVARSTLKSRVARARAGFRRMLASCFAFELDARGTPVAAVARPGAAGACCGTYGQCGGQGERCPGMRS